MGLRLRFFLWLLHRKPDQISSMDLNQYRKQVNKSWKTNRRWIDGRLINVNQVTDELINNRHGYPIRVRSYQSKIPNGKVLFYLHGGGWVGRNIDTYDNFCRRVCRNTAMTVYSIGYRLSPETKFPGAIEDGLDVIRHLVSRHRLDENKLHICGDSAGGNMAIGMIYLLRFEIQFQKLLLLYPPVSAKLDQPSMEAYGQGFIIEKDNIAWMRDQYLDSPEQFVDPLVSPLYHQDFDFLPPTIVTIGGKDPLYDQVMEFTRKVQASGKSVALHQYPTLPHGFYLLHNLSKSVKKAYRDVYRVFTRVDPG